MQINLSETEVAKIVLDSINKHFADGGFNKVQFNGRYNADFAEVTREEKEPE